MENDDINDDTVVRTFSKDEEPASFAAVATNTAPLPDFLANQSAFGGGFLATTNWADRWDAEAETILTVWRTQVQALKQALELLTNLFTHDEDTKEPLPLVRLTQRATRDVLPALRRQCAGYIAQADLASLCAMALATNHPANSGTESKGADQELPGELLTAEQLSLVCVLLDGTRDASLCCLANAVLLLPLQILSPLPSLMADACAWTDRLSPAHTAGALSAVRELGSISRLMWHILQKDTIVPDVSQFQLLMGLARTGKSSDIRVHLAGILRCLGLNPALAPRNLMIAAVLLEMLQLFIDQNEFVTLEVVVEVVDAIMDIYSEDKTHTQAIQQSQLLQKLQRFLPVMREHAQAWARSEKRNQDRAFDERLDETLTNLAAFLQYKPAHV